MISGACGGGRYVRTVGLEAARHNVQINLIAQNWTPEGRYRISGTRGSRPQVMLQFRDEYPMLGLGYDILVINFDDLGGEPGEGFELHKCDRG